MDPGTPKPQEQLIERIAEAIYEEPYVGCDKCGGVGSSDDGCYFRCSVCEGKGYVVDAEQVEVMQEMAWADAVAALDCALAHPSLLLAAIGAEQVGFAYEGNELFEQWRLPVPEPEEPK